MFHLWSIGQGSINVSILVKVIGSLCHSGSRLSLSVYTRSMTLCLTPVNNAPDFTVFCIQVHSNRQNFGATRLKNVNYKGYKQLWRLNDRSIRKNEAKIWPMTLDQKLVPSSFGGYPPVLGKIDLWPIWAQNIDLLTYLAKKSAAALYGLLTIGLGVMGANRNLVGYWLL